MEGLEGRGRDWRGRGGTGGAGEGLERSGIFLNIFKILDFYKKRKTECKFFFFQFSIIVCCCLGRVRLFDGALAHK